MYSKYIKYILLTVAIVFSLVFINFFFNKYEKIEIVPLNDKNINSQAKEVWITNLIVNNQVVELGDYIIKSEGWSEKDGARYAIGGESGALSLKVKAKEKVKIEFGMHDWSGIVSIRDKNGERIVDLFSDESTPIVLTINTSHYLWIFGNIMMLALWFIYLVFLLKEPKQHHENDVSLNSKQFVEIDALKGLSALGIAGIYHLSMGGFGYMESLPLWEVPSVRWFYEYGYLLVELLFLLSGFIFFAYFGERIRKHEISPKEFALSCIIRIIPLLTVTTGVMTLGQIIYHNLYGKFWLDKEPYVLDILLQSLGLSSFFGAEMVINFPAWIITTFFVCWGIGYFILYTAKSKYMEITYCVIIMVCGIALSYHPIYDIPFLNANIARGYLPFFMGGGIFMLWKRLSVTARQKSSYICMIWLLFCYFLHLLGVSLGAMSISIVLCVYVPLVIICMGNYGIRNLLNNRVLSYLGKISFSVYLWNAPFQIFTWIIVKAFNLTIDFSTLSFFVVQMILQIALAHFSTNVLEKYFADKLRPVISRM